MKKSTVAPKNLTGTERDTARSLRRSADDVPRGAAKPPQTVERYQRFTDDDLSEALLTERDGEDDDLSSADDMERDDTGGRRGKGALDDRNRRRAGSAGAGSGERSRGGALLISGSGGGNGGGGGGRHHGYASEGGGPAASAAAWNDGAAAALMGERRFPKRGGRGRMRRPRVARKGRVSAYCIAKEIKVAELLEYFVMHRNRHQWLDTPRTRRRTLQSQPPTVLAPSPPTLLPPPPQQQLQAAPAPPSSAVSDVYSPLLGTGTLRSHTYGDREEDNKDKDATSKAEEGRAPAAGGGGGGGSGGGDGGQVAPSQGGGGGLSSSLSPRPAGSDGGGGGGSGGGRGGAVGVTFGPGTGMGLERLQWRDTMYVDVVHSSTSPDPAKAAKAAAARRRNGCGNDNGNGNGEDYGDDEAMGDEWNYKDVLYFRYGCVVFYNCTVEEEKRILLQLKPFIMGPVSEIELEESQDDMNFVYADPNDPSSRAGRIKNDEITFETRDPLEKVSYAFGMAQSAKLFVFEERLEGTVSKTQRYPEELARLGRITLTEREINRMIGKVLVERNEVNLHSDVLDTPEFFWEADRWEPGYQKLTKYLDIPVRVEVLNQRLDVLRELLDVLNNQIENRHAVKLELIIIWLIVFEVVIECFWNVLIKDILGFFPGSDRAAGW